MYCIRHATADDIPAIKQTANQYKGELGFVNRAALQEAVERRELFVAALHDEQVVGFVNWHARRDGWHTVYELAVRRDLTGFGIGRALLYAVPTPTRLKCTTDNDAANRFYTGAGMTLVRTEDGRKRRLNVYERRVLYVLVRGNNREMPRVARESGMAYGTRHIEKPRDWPYMVDIHWRDYDWQDYMQKITLWRPVTAMCADYEHPSQRRQLYRQIRDLKAAGVMRVMVCPKFAGAVAHIPRRCVVGVSVPSSYAGFVPDFAELRGRRVHLLGGSPHAQRRLTVEMGGAEIHVLSMDGNMHSKAAQTGTWWSGYQWCNGREPGKYYELMRLSGRNIVRTMEIAATMKQLPLL